MTEPRPQLLKQQGFTLFEVIIVIVIISIITAVALMTFNRFDDSREVKVKTNQLMMVMPAAEQQAILQPAVIAMQFTEHGYQFSRLTRDSDSGKFSWAPLRDDMLSAKKAFSDSITVSVKTHDGQLPFDKDSNSDDASRDRPKIIFLPTGDATPATITLIGKRSKSTKTIRISANGNIEVDK